MPETNDWEGVRLHVVTGKGGAGKTTMAAALALALATSGRRVLLMEVEGRQGLSRLFDVPPLPYEEKPLAVAPGGGEVIGLAVDPEEALMEYLEMFYNLRRAGTALKKIGAIDFATTIAPGIRDVLLTGKAKEAVRRKNAAGRPVFDAVVLDAPPTGRITKFLNVNHEVAGLARVGPIRNQADAVMEVIASPLTAIHIVTLLEEMPVQETTDGVAELRAAALPVGAIMVNMVRAPLLTKAALGQALKGRLDLDQMAADLHLAGLAEGNSLVMAGTKMPLTNAVSALATEAGDHGERVALEQRERAAVVELERPTYDLPWLPDGIDLGALYVLAERLRSQGAA